MVFIMFGVLLMRRDQQCGGARHVASLRLVVGTREPGRCVPRAGRAARSGAEVVTGHECGSNVLQPACLCRLLCRASNACLPCVGAPYAVWTQFFGWRIRSRREQHARVFCAARRGRDKEREHRDRVRCRVVPCVAPKGSGPSHAQNSGRFSTQVMILGVLST